MKRIRNLLRAAVSVAALTLLFTGLIVAARTVGRGGESELLVYRSYTYDGQSPPQITFFDLHHHLEISLPIFTGEFIFGGNGRLAVSSNHDGNSNVYIVDTSSMNNTLIAINQNSPTHDIPIPVAWSPDGQYLAIIAYGLAKRSLYVWDGERVINITPPELASIAGAFFPAWSYDGRLAYSVLRGNGDAQSEEIYLWDGSITVNLRQNPSGRDRFPTWSARGQLAFLAENDGEFDIYVWDGHSTKEGSLDIETFINVAPELTNYDSIPMWTPQGGLAFEVQEGSDKAIYLWDGQSATNISQNPNASNRNPVWSLDGRWAFTAIAPNIVGALIFVRDEENHTIAKFGGQFAPALSSSGYLMFCRANGSKWALYVWDGTNLIKVVEGDYINAQWANGAIVVCASA